MDGHTERREREEATRTVPQRNRPGKRPRDRIRWIDMREYGLDDYDIEV